MTTPRRVLVADDEPLARERIRLLLARHPGWELAAESVDGDDALDAIRRLRPDVAFLDISMPGLNGLDVAEQLKEDHRAPAIVFVTAHDDHALRAFEVSALDYLVKPVDRDRFAQMLERLDRLVGERELPRRFPVRSPRGHYFVPADDIESASAEGNYIALAAGGRVHLVRETMRSFETKVDPARFVRIHRSTIVNIDCVARIEPQGHAVYRVTMKSGSRFDSSPTYVSRITALLR